MRISLRSHVAPARPRTLTIVASFIVGLLLTLLLGCDTEDCSSGDPSCAEQICSDRDCAEEERCVNNRCSAPCSSANDCRDARCVDMYTDYGTRGRFCLSDPDSPEPDDSLADDDSGTDDASVRCERSRDCGMNRGERCVDGLCRLTCLLHEHCGVAGACSQGAEDTEGESVALCKSDGFPRDDGQFDALCVNGQADCAKDFVCISTGEGDLASYCTTAGCQDDEECPTGYYCNHRVLTNTPPCESACGVTPMPQDPDCIPPEEIGKGRPFSCTERGLQLTRCLRRDFCHSCKSDADCRGLPDQICARNQAGKKICTQLCDPEFVSCPWANASECGVWDEDLGLPTCSHQDGSCQQKGRSCEACLDDRDCPNGFCAISGYSGEHFCYDATVSCSCPEGEQFCIGGGCPDAPSGLATNCVSRGDGLPPDVCFGALVDPSDISSGQGCWPE